MTMSESDLRSFSNESDSVVYEDNETSPQSTDPEYEAWFKENEEIRLNQAVKIDDLKKEIKQLKEHISVQAFVIRDLEQVNTASQATIHSLNYQARLKYEDEQKLLEDQRVLKATADSLKQRNEELISLCVQQYETKEKMKMVLMKQAVENEQLKGSDHVTDQVFKNVGSLLSTVIRSGIE